MKKIRKIKMTVPIAIIFVAVMALALALTLSGKFFQGYLVQSGTNGHLTVQVSEPQPDSLDQPFNKGAANAQLGSIANTIQSCKKGTTAGQGSIVVTFDSEGGVQSTVLKSLIFDGTPTGACITARFRNAKVPPFSGNPVAVAWDFTIH